MTIGLEAPRSGTEPLALAEDAAHAAIDEAFAAIERIHRLMSFHELQSDVSRLNREAASAAVTVDAQTVQVLAAALELARESDGLFDICSAAVRLVEWGFLPAPPGAPPPHPGASWQHIELEPPHRVRFRLPLWIDLGGIAKGHAVDAAVDVLRRRIPTASCRVNAGGDLRVAGPEMLQVRLRVPGHPRERQPLLEIRDASVASSCGRELRRRRRGRWVGPHVDVRAGSAASTSRFVCVVCERCRDADGLTKTVIAAGGATAALLARRGARAHVFEPRRGWSTLGMAA